MNPQSEYSGLEAFAAALDFLEVEFTGSTEILACAMVMLVTRRVSEAIAPIVQVYPRLRVRLPFPSFTRPPFRHARRYERHVSR